MGDRLIAEGLITREQLAQALGAQKGTRDKVGTILVRLGLLTEERLLSFLSEQHNVPSTTLTQLDIDPEVLRLVPGPLAEKLEVLPDQALRQYADPGDGRSHQRAGAR